MTVERPNRLQTMSVDSMVVTVFTVLTGMVIVCVARPEAKFHIYLKNKTTSRILNHSSLNRVGFIESDNIVFPDTYKLVFEPLPVIDGPPPCAEGQTFCEDYEAYPQHQIEEILQRREVHRDLFGQDEVPIDVTNRLGNHEDIFVCGSVDRTIFPKVAKNKNNKWKFVINSGEREGYIQGVRVEICRRDGAPCEIIGNAPTGYITTCKQKYIYRKLMSVTHSGEPVPDLFPLPSACCCAYRTDFSFLRNFGSASVTPSKS